MMTACEVTALPFSSSDGAAIFQRHDVTVPHQIKADGLPVDEIRPEYSLLLNMRSASS